MKYVGSCHCQKLKFEIEATLESVLSCNCSICHKKGHLLIFVPENQFKMLSSTETLADYQFAKKSIHHNFCSHCGVGAFGSGSMPDGTKMRSINVRCLENVDIGKIPVQHYDGANL